MDNILKEHIDSLIILFGTAAIVVVIFKIFGKIEKDKAWPGPVKMILAIIFSIGGLILFISSLELSNNEQILKYITLIVTAGIAISSTSVLGNLIAGIVSNSMKRFTKGDYIKLNNEFEGIVINLNAFNISIQSDDSNFITVPNLHVISKPIKRIRKTDIHVVSTVSLGYDVPKERVKEALMEAAILTELKKPFIRITELGDYSIVYKISGLYDDNSTLMKTRSELNENVIDQMHKRNIEIVSPAFINERRIDPKINIIPMPTMLPVTKPPSPKEPAIFDVGQIAKKIQELTDEKNKLELKIKEQSLAKESDIVKILEERIKSNEQQIVKFQKELDQKEINI